MYTACEDCAMYVKHVVAFLFSFFLGESITELTLNFLEFHSMASFALQTTTKKSISLKAVFSHYENGGLLYCQYILPKYLCLHSSY